MIFKKNIRLSVTLILLLLQMTMAKIEAASLTQHKNQEQIVQQQQQQQHQIHQQQLTHPQTAATQHATQPSQQSQQQPLQQQQQQQLQQQQHQQQPHQMQQVQYVHEKETLPDSIRHINSEEDFSDPYHFTNDYKHDPRLPWNPYQQHRPPLPQFERLPLQQQTSLPPPPPGFSGLDGLPMFHTPKFLPLIGFPQPVFIPYPLYIAPEMFYPTFSSPLTADMEDTMSRARRPSSIGGGSGYHRNSPIYYVRLPPTPYMFLPSLGYSHSPPGFGAGFSPVLPFQSLPTFPSFSSIYNLPLNFLANGKPTSIYQMGGSPTDIQSHLHFGAINGFNTRPPPPSPYRPTSASSSYYPQQPFGAISSSTSSASPHEDSKMTTLKRPFVFNGRPDDIYILPNDYNSIYSNNGYY